jgi:hypothetical protein
MVIVGNLGQFWLGIDERYLLTAPGHLIFKAGLLTLAVGSAIFAAIAARTRLLPLWGAYPLAAASAGSAFAFLYDLGSAGSSMWIFFGLSWSWVAISMLVQSLGVTLANRLTAPPRSSTLSTKRPEAK